MYASKYRPQPKYRNETKRAAFITAIMAGAKRCNRPVVDSDIFTKSGAPCRWCGNTTQDGGGGGGGGGNATVAEMKKREWK